MVVGDKDIVEDHLVEDARAQLRHDRAHGHARPVHLDEDLAHAGVAVLAALAGAHQRHHVVRMVGARGPDLAAVDLPPAFHLGAARADRSQVGTRVRLAHADADKGLAAADLRNDLRRKLVAAVADQQRPHLPVRGPVRAHRRADGQQFFEHHIALQHALAAAAELGRPGHAEPALLAHLFRECGVASGPVVRTIDAGIPGHVLFGKRPDFFAQRLAFCRQVAYRNVQRIHVYPYLLANKQNSIVNASNPL
ncbi:hypothetical protein CBM2633_B10531 [Cupriavidus taiwanensis]|nr:hypothetical protein CBM2633_B10531 [Cupriavidus taiwanensis]